MARFLVGPSGKPIKLDPSILLIRGKMLRCCSDTIADRKLNDPVEGLEIPCDHCSDNMIFRDGAWESLINTLGIQ